MQELKDKMPPKTPLTEKTWADTRLYKNCTAIWPFMRLAVWVFFLAFSYYLYQRDTVAAQGISLIDLQRNQQTLKDTITERGITRDKQVQAIETKMVTAQLFDERTNAIQQRLDRIEKMQEEILMRLPVSR